MLVRLDGSVLSKEAVLHDLKLGGLTFKSIELAGEGVRIHGETAILTGEGRTLALQGRQGTLLALPPRSGLRASRGKAQINTLSKYATPGRAKCCTVGASGLLEVSVDR